MKRERRLLGITGDDKIIVSVLYRGNLWFESVDVKCLKRYPMKVEELVEIRYLEQARIVFFDEALLKYYDIKMREKLLSHITKPIIIVKEHGQFDVYKSCNEEVRGLYLRSEVPEALRIARKIFYEARGILRMPGKR